MTAENLLSPGQHPGSEVPAKPGPAHDDVRETVGIALRLTPEWPRGYSVEDAATTVRWAAAYRERGVVGVGVSGIEKAHSVAPYEHVFASARGAGLAVVPHAGEHAGAWSVRECLELLAPRRIRHGIRAVDDPSLIAELAATGIVLDVCLTSNVRTGATSALAAHPLPRLLEAGVACSISTDDPAFFDTDLRHEHCIASRFGLRPRMLYEVGVRGAACDPATRAWLAEVGAAYDWTRLVEIAGQPRDRAVVDRNESGGSGRRRGAEARGEVERAASFVGGEESAAELE